PVWPSGLSCSLYRTSPDATGNASLPYPGIDRFVTSIAVRPGRRPMAAITGLLEPFADHRAHSPGARHADPVRSTRRSFYAGSPAEHRRADGPAMCRPGATTAAAGAASRTGLSARQGLGTG